LAVVASAVVALAAPAPSPAASISQSPAQASLAAFEGCHDVVRYGRRHAPRLLKSASDLVFGEAQSLTAKPESAGPAPALGEDDSLTNVQEPGIDEPDIVKTDGSRIFAVAGNSLHSIDVTGETPVLLDSLELEGRSHELFLALGRILVVSEIDGDQPKAPGKVGPADIQSRPGTLLVEIDVSDPGALTVRRTQRVPGQYVSARLNGTTARVVISSYPAALAGLEEHGRKLRSRVAGWLPSTLLKDRVAGAKTKTRLIDDCEEVRHPTRFSGLGLLTVLTIDLTRGLPAVDADALLTDVETVYASAQSLYVATGRWSPDFEPLHSTAIHRFDASDPLSTAYSASGEVPGFLLNQFSLSEHEGYLRAATTVSGKKPRDDVSHLTVLQEQPGSGILTEVGQLDGIGLGERIQSVRFIGDAGFVVTFRLVDPLHAVDLSVPTQPALAGELEIPGFSSYLHPLSPGRLLGVGQNVTDEGDFLGTQVSLFDISNLAQPIRLYERTILNAQSSAELDHHAFLHWPAENLVVLPISIYAPKTGKAVFSGAIGLNVDASAGITDRGLIDHPAKRPPEVRRSLVVADRLFTMSDRGIEMEALATLAEQAWLPFPAPAEEK
jgi:hypothetical protein